MDEAEGLGVEGLTGAYLEAVVDESFVGAAALAAQYLGAAVGLVAEEGVADVLHVGSYLMGAAGLEAAFDEGDVAELLDYAPVGDGILAYAGVGGGDCHAQAVLGVAGDVALDASLVGVEVAPDEAVVDAVSVVDEELLAEGSLCLRRLGDDEQAAGVFVDAVDEAYLGTVGVEGGNVAHVPCHGIDEGAVEIACSGMHHHAGGLVDDHEDVVLIDDVEGYVFGVDGAVVLGNVEHEGDDVARTHLVVALDGTAADLYIARLGSRLYAVA